MKKNKSIKLPFAVIGTLLTLLSTAIIIAADWAKTTYDELDFNMLLFHLMVPLEGTDTGQFTGVILKCAIISPIVALIVLFMANKCNDDRKLVLRISRLKLNFSVNFFKKHYALNSFLVFVIVLLLACHTIGLDAYIKNQLNPSTLIEDRYADPKTVNITFPEQKRNLIYVYMESMETTFTDPIDGGNLDTSLIPNLTRIQHENTGFTDPNGFHINGMLPSYGTTWTVASMVAQTSGLPLMLPVSDNSMDEYSSFLPGAYSLGEILAQNGYTNEFIMGSDAVFGGRKSYLTQHGNYKIFDYNTATENGYIPWDYYNFWGFEDEKLYVFAEAELTNLANSGEPFNLSILTVDTHSVEGNLCTQCAPAADGKQYSSVLSCADRQINNFLEWCKTQDFYDNTTIIVVGDHPFMNNEYMLDTMIGYYSYQRKSYVAVINSPVSYELGRDRLYTPFDMYPTTLASLGVTIEGDKLGLGVNLYSHTMTLAEEFGFEALDNELKRGSSFYNRHILY